MSPLKIVIIDDERLAQELLESYLEKLPNVEHLASFRTATEAIPFLQTQALDGLLLDIELPDLSGLQLLRTLATPPPTILTTAYSSYALDGYALQVIDYLLKPIEFARFVQAMNRLSGAAKQPTLAVKPDTSQQSFFFVRADQNWIKVNYQDVLFVEAMQKYVRIHTPQERIVSLMSMKKIEEALSDQAFIRIHRSYIVRIDQIERVDSTQVIIAGQSLPLSQSYRDRVLERIRALGL